MNETSYIGLHELAEKHPMFSFDDKDMVRYEMVREWIITKQSAEQIAEKYNYSRSRIHVNAKRIEEEGLAGILNKKRGPKEPTKVTAEIEKLVLNIRKKEDKSIDEIAKDLKEKHGISVSAKAVDIVLTKHKIPKKKRGRKPNK